LSGHDEPRRRQGVAPVGLGLEVLEQLLVVLAGTLEVVVDLQDVHASPRCLLRQRGDDHRVGRTVHPLRSGRNAHPKRLHHKRFPVTLHPQAAVDGTGDKLWITTKSSSSGCTWRLGVGYGVPARTMVGSRPNWVMLSALTDLRSRTSKPGGS